MTILHVTDSHAQLMPLYFREPSVNLGVGEARGKPPHLTDGAFREHFQIAAGSAEAYALTADDFVALARNYGRMGGIDRIATVINAIRAERGDDEVLLLDGGDTWQGSWTALKTKAQDMVDVIDAAQDRRDGGPLGVHLRRRAGDEIAESAPFAFLRRTSAIEWQEPVFEARKTVRARRRQDRRHRPGAAAHADRQSALDDPELGVRHPRGRPAEAGRRGARRGRRRRRAALAQRLRRRPQAGRRVKGIDVILTAHTHDAMPGVDPGRRDRS